LSQRCERLVDLVQVPAGHPNRVEVRSRLEHLLTEAVEDRIADLPALPDGVPGTVARRLAAELLGE